jgi:hypothetical protein
MPLSEPHELDGVTVGSSELSIVSGTTSLQTITTDGVYELWVDPVGAGLAKGDEFRVRVYEKVEDTGGTKRVAFSASISDAQSQVWVFPPLYLMHGWDMTIQKIAGTDRAFDASVRGVTGAGLTQRAKIDGVSVTVAELSIVSGTTSLQTIAEPGFYQLWVDPMVGPMANGDEFEVRILEKVEGTGGTKREVFSARLADVQAELFISPILYLYNGWDMTLKLVSGGGAGGSGRAFDASIRKVA